MQQIAFLHFRPATESVFLQKPFAITPTTCIYFQLTAPNGICYMSN